MIVQRHFIPLTCLEGGSVVAIGNFDGVHKGHEAVLARAKALAEENDVPLVLLTFEPHPRAVLQPEKAPGRITLFSDKARLVQALGVDVLSVAHFTRSFAAQSAADFMQHILHATLRAQHVVVGDDFAFGRGREGTVEAMQQVSMTMGFTTHSVTAVMDDVTGSEMASTLVRVALSEGDVRHAARLLGRPWQVRGRLQRTKEGFSLHFQRYTALKNGAYQASFVYTGARVGGKETAPLPLFPLHVQHNVAHIAAADLPQGFCEGARVGLALIENLTE